MFWWLITVIKEKNYMSQIQQDVWSEEVFTQATAAYEAGYGIRDLKPELPKPAVWQQQIAESQVVAGCERQEVPART